MHNDSARGAAYLGLLSIALLIGCDRHDYSTWSCKDQLGNKSSLILKKAQMQFQEKSFSYCGSLGVNSYFDSSCPPRIDDSVYLFVPSTGRMLKNGTQEFQCEAL
jgi:hypothetical protein